MKNCLVTNSGSSSNLVAVTALCSPTIKNPMKPGDEVITTAMTLPTTLNPIIQNRLIPVFIDIEEDTCDALDSKYDGEYCGTYGDFLTYSFYAAHHMTMGEGGAVCTNSMKLYKAALSIRDWGRACFCQTGEADQAGACKNRFNFKFEGLPD